MEQFGRIWRAMVIAQFADTFGPYPLEAAKGENPAYNSEKEVYQFILSELRDAVKKIDTSVKPTENQAKCDPAYGYEAAKWQKLGNSLRMRYAMRLTNTEIAADAQTEFEDACKGGNFIKDKADMLWFKSDNGWNDYSNPYTRGWNLQALSSTMANLMNNLGGVKISEQRADLAQYAKKNTYLGLKFEKHFVANTDDPTKQYWLDGIPENLDPRALKMFWMVNDNKATNAVTSDIKNTKIDARGSYLVVADKDSMWVKVTIRGTEYRSAHRAAGLKDWKRMALSPLLQVFALSIRCGHKTTVWVVKKVWDVWYSSALGNLTSSWLKLLFVTGIPMV